MTTSRRMLLTSAISDDAPLSPAQRAYFRGRLRNRIHDVILRVFLDKKAEGFTKADLARRLGKAPEQVTRWLAAPGNLRLDTVSDLLLAMKHELDFSASPIELQPKQNEFHEIAAIKPSAVSTSEGAKVTITRKSGYSVAGSGTGWHSGTVNAD